MTSRILLFGIIFFVSCNSHGFQSKFDRKKWGTKEDWDYPYRDEMLEDLIKHHQLKGLSIRRLEDSLGYLENFTDTDSLYYQVLMDFGSDIDPVHTKYLTFKLNKDSIVTDFSVKEWEKP